MTRHRSRVPILGLILLALSFHLMIVGQDFETLARNGFLYDDSFYAFKIARNVAAGEGVTFDGVVPTNGFQPLYVFLLVPVYWLAGSDLVTPIYVALVISAILTALTALLLFRILRRYVGDNVALVASAIWAFSPVVARQAANGLETALALFLFAWSVDFYLGRIRRRDGPPGRDFVILGVLLSLTVLARIDGIFLAFAMLLDYLLILRKRPDRRHEIRGVLASITAGLVIYSPWIIYNLITMKTLMPESGAATRFLSMAYAPFFGLGSSELSRTGPDVGFLWGHVVHSFLVLKLAPPFHIFFRALERTGDAVGAPGLFAAVANVSGMLVLAGMLYLILWRRRDPAVAGVGEVRFLLVAAGALVAAYSLYVFGVFFFTRYFYPVYFVSCVYVGFLIAVLSGPLRRHLGRRARSVMAFAAGIYVVGFAFMAYSKAFRSYPVYHFYDVAQWVVEHTDPDEMIGVFQGGAIGYLSDRRVINLDGKVNHEALEALRAGTMSSYIRAKGIDVVLDSPAVLDLFLDAEVNEDDTQVILTHYDRISDATDDRLRGWVAYRISDAGARVGSSFGRP